MFIGRDHELEKLERIYKYNGNGLAIVLVGGNKGIGKTTLVEEFPLRSVREQIYKNSR